jgi:hypothetical protein
MDYQTSDDFSPLLLIDMLTSGATKSRTTATPLQFGDTDLIEARYNFGSFLTRLIRRQYTTPEINCICTIVKTNALNEKHSLANTH